MAQTHSDVIRWVTDFTVNIKNKGLDTIAYAPDPLEPTKMRFVIEEYHRFDRQSIKKAVEYQIECYDEYDKRNNLAACNVLLNSLENGLYKKISNDISDNENFCVMYLKVIFAVQRPSDEFYRNVENRIRARLPEHFGGQNINSFCTASEKDFNTLVAGNALRPDLIIQLCMNLHQGSMNDPFFINPLVIKEQEARKDNLHARWKPYEEVLQIMKDNETYWTFILDLVKALYDERVQAGQWRPLLHTRQLSNNRGRFQGPYLGNMAQADGGCIKVGGKKSQGSEGAQANQLIQ